MHEDDAILGLRQGVNVLVDHHPGWAALFSAERTRIEAAVGPFAEGIEHYGSSAVPGLRAKPIIDILVGLRDVEDWRKCHDPLLAIGYDYAAGAGVPGHHVFGRGRQAGERSYIVHLVAFDGQSWRSNLDFRDALRGSSELRVRYEAVKTAAVAAAPEGRARYNELKQDFIADEKARLGTQ